MKIDAITLALGAALFCAVVVALNAGHRLGRRKPSRAGADPGSGLGAVDGAVFALLGLLIAFTFSNAAARFDERRRLISDEVNAIGTAYLRLDLLPPGPRAQLRGEFIQYVGARLEMYRDATDLAATEAAKEHGAALQLQIWTQAVQAAEQPGAASSAQMLLLPAVNAMIDITGTRQAVARSHPPPVIYAMLIILVLVSSFLAGHSMAVSDTKSPVHVLNYALVLTVAILVIVDLEFPRVGFVRIDAADQMLVELQRSMR